MSLTMSFVASGQDLSISYPVVFSFPEPLAAGGEL